LGSWGVDKFHIYRKIFTTFKGLYHHFKKFNGNLEEKKKTDYEDLVLRIIYEGNNKRLNLNPWEIL
jgi:hypothetical protein